MFLQKFQYYCLSLTTFALIVMSGCATVTVTEEQFQKLFAITELNRGTDKSDYENEKNITRVFETLFGSHFRLNRIRQLPDNDLMLLFRATQDAAFYTVDSRYTGYMQSVVTELENRKLTNATNYFSLYKQHIKSRNFENARQLESRLLDLTYKLPLFITNGPATSGAPEEWVLDLETKAAVKKTVDLSRDWLVIVVSHPLCHFSRNAALEIFSDSTLATNLHGHIKWITPQEGSFDFEQIAAWNKKNPSAQTSIVHQRNAWPLENFTTTPYFYFLSNGKVVDKFEGWPKGGNKSKLIAALAKLDSVGKRTP